MVGALVVGGCGLVAGIEDIEDAPASNDASTSDVVSPPDAASADAAPTTDAPALPSCAAQRLVHLVGGNGGFAWFTLQWPNPAIATSASPDVAIDDPRSFTSVGSVSHPLYARIVGGGALFAGSGKSPQPSVFVAGVNQTHSATPTATTSISGKSAIAYGTIAQRPLGAKVPTIALGGTGPVIGTAPGIPLVTNVAGVEEAVKALVDVGYTESAIRPDPAIAARWYAPGAPAKISNLALSLLFAVRAFEAGAVATIVIPAMSDDPHGAFASGNAAAGAVANDIAGILAGFYTELARSYETTCGHAGARLSLADNVVLTATGDTFKNSFVKDGWADGTPGNSNLLVVRSNGWLEPGWFGRLPDASTRVNFDPATGLASATATNAQSTAAAVDGLLYAITRGNTSFVASFDGSEYGGVRKTPPP